MRFPNFVWCEYLVFLFLGFSFHSSRLQPDQKRLKQESSHSAEQLAPDSSVSTTREAASKESKHQTHPVLDLARPVGEDEELTPEEVQMVLKLFFLTCIQLLFCF